MAHFYKGWSSLLDQDREQVLVYIGYITGLHVILNKYFILETSSTSL